jgi:ATP-dependent DNA helicase RecG
LSYPLFHPQRVGSMPMLLALTEFGREFPGEGDHVEFKQGVSTQRIAEACVAFSNTDGGVILIGVSDVGEIKGRPLEGETAARIHEAIRTAHDPGRYELHEVLVDDRPVVVVAVDRRREGFSQTSAGQVLVRRGAMNVPLLGSELVGFLTRRRLSRFELTPTKYLLAAADPKLLQEVTDAWGWTSSDVSDRLVERGMAVMERHEMHLTVAGVLYLTMEPQRLLGKYVVEIFRYRDLGVDYDKRVEINGPVHHQVARATEAIMDELGFDLVVLGRRRFELPRLPEVVVREAIANALAHRSYEAKTRSVRVEIRPDVVRIVSPGPLPEPVTIANIREQNAPRNLEVIATLRRFRLAEDAGRGVDVMQDEMHANLLEPPEFDDDGTSVAVTLRLSAVVAPAERAWLQQFTSDATFTPNDRHLLVMAARGETLTNSSARQRLGIDSTQTRAALQRLRDRGLLIQTGQRSGSRYHLAPDIVAPGTPRQTPLDVEATILELASRGPITNTIVRDHTGLDRAQATAALDRLVRNGKLRRVGERRGTRYLPAKPSG